MNNSSVAVPNFYHHNEEGTNFSFTGQAVVQQKRKATKADFLALGKKNTVQSSVLASKLFSPGTELASHLTSVLQETSIARSRPTRSTSCEKNSSLKSLLSFLNPGGAQSNPLHSSLTVYSFMEPMSSQLKQALFNHWSCKQTTMQRSGKELRHLLQKFEDDREVVSKLSGGICKPLQLQ